MNKAEALFKAIDIIFDPFQNYIKVPGIDCEKDYSYDDRYPECKADFYYKKPLSNMPVLINIHGGGYVMGDKHHRRSLSAMYADRGWFVININYRLAPKYSFPAPIEDVFALLKKLPELADKYSLDLSRLVITGDSSGAYTSAHVVACLNDEALRTSLGLPESPVKPSALIGFCGPYDVLAAIKIKEPFGIVRSIAQSITGRKFKKDYSDMSEYQYLKQLAPAEYVNSSWCPTLLTYAQKDVFCAGQGEIMYDKLKAAGVPCAEVHTTGIVDNHCYHFNFWTKASKTTMKAVFDFLEKVKNNEAIA